MTPTQNSNVPKLRFSAFQGIWSKEKIGRFILDYREKSTKMDQHAVLTSARKGLQLQSEYFGENRLTERDNTGFNVIPPGYITYRSRSDNREFFFNENTLGLTGIISVYYPVFRINHGSNRFFVELLNSNRHFIGRYSVGTSQTVLSLNDLKSIKLAIPRRDEQIKIAAFLSSVDTKIAQLARKKALLADYKKGCMQQLFSQKIRFKDDDGNDFPDWEEKRLGKVATFSKGKGISKADITVNGTTPCIRYGEIYTTYREHITEVKSATDVDLKSLFMSKAQDVIIPASGEDPLDMARACCVEDAGIALGGDINVLRGAQNGVFLAYYLNNAKRKEIASYAQGNSVVHIYASQMRNLEVSLPHPIEQRKIADFLSALDHKIDLVAQELTHARRFKAGLLQQMFV